MLKHGSSVGVLARSGVRPVARTRNASTRAVRPDPAPSLRHPAFQDLEDRLGRLPCFRARAHDCVKVLYEPQEFYQSLLVSVHLALSTFNICLSHLEAGLLQRKIRHAKQRIFIASLYVGKEEKELVRPLPLSPVWLGAKV